VDSIYSQMFQRNRCNHREYQNIAVNGAGSGKLAGIVPTVARNPTTDFPALTFYATIGDDVCSQHQDMDHMTTPQEFYTNVMKALLYLDSGVLPTGSHVVFVGLVDARILWNSLHNTLNPVGRTYEEIYSYLACLGVNPCWQWLNPNSTLRDMASARAAALSAVFNDIINNATFSHFDMAYVAFPLEEIIELWTKNGGKVSQLIEPVDGFHPSQIGHYLSAQYMWTWLLQNQPSFVGDSNPYNSIIQTLFGDQGGY